MPLSPTSSRPRLRAATALPAATRVITARTALVNTVAGRRTTPILAPVEPVVVLGHRRRGLRLHSGALQEGQAACDGVLPRLEVGEEGHPITVLVGMLEFVECNVP